MFTRALAGMQRAATDFFEVNLSTACCLTFDVRPVAADWPLPAYAPV